MGKSKLSVDQIREIMFSEDSIKEIARKYDLCLSHVYEIRRGMAWFHITQPLLKEKRERSNK